MKLANLLSNKSIKNLENIASRIKNRVKPIGTAVTRKDPMGKDLNLGSGKRIPKQETKYTVNEPKKDINRKDPMGNIYNRSNTRKSVNTEKSKGSSYNEPKTKGVASEVKTEGVAVPDEKFKNATIDLEHGGSPTESLWGQAKASLSMGGKNISEAVKENHGGSYGAFLGGAALKGAVWGGAIGGTVSAAQGGDFWSGAKSGAFKGALGGAGYRSLKAATKSSSRHEMIDNGRTIWAHHARDGVSKSVKAVTQVAKDAAINK